MFRERELIRDYPFRSLETIDDVFYNGNTIYWTPPSQRVVYEWIIPNKSSKKRSRPWKSFQHYKSVQVSPKDGELPAIGVVRQGTDGGNLEELLHIADFAFFSDLGRPGEPFEGLTPMFLGELDKEYREVPEPNDLEFLVQASLNKMTPEIRKSLSLINSLIELKDIVTLKETAHRMRAVVLALTNRARKLRTKGHRLHTLRKVLEAAADGYLQAQFNILPLISDIRAVMSVLFRNSGRPLGELENDGKVVTLRFFRKFTEFVDTNEESFPERNVATQFTQPGVPMYSFFGRVTPFRSVSYSPSVFHAQLQCSFEYSAVQRQYAGVFSKLDALGVNLNPAIIWNAIPWSFVVDWVTGVSTLLDQYKVGLMDPKITILQYLWSIKRERVIRTALNWDSYRSPWFTQWTGRANAPAIIQSAYRREVGLPESSSFTLSGLSPGEFSLAVALAITRRRRHKKRKRKPRVGTI
jgi:hypothetical protein